MSVKELFFNYALPALLAFAACWGFCVLFNIHGNGIWICCGGGGLGWLVYLIFTSVTGSDMTAGFLAGIFISLWSESMARVRRCPVTGYLLVAFFPLVPGGGIYYAMEQAIQGKGAAFASTLMHTLGFSGVLALGVLVVSSTLRMWTMVRRKGGQKGEKSL